MASQTIGFAISDEDRTRLDRLVEHFGGGNRSAYLRATLKVMESLRRAERLRELQAANHRRLAERGVSAEDLPALIQQAYKEQGGDEQGSEAPAA
jgi:Arc/MetJ-type ribon-helix-helix transcriptional regulator